MTARSTAEVVAGFTHDAHTARVVFGVDAHRTSLLPELQRLGTRTVLFLASASQRKVTRRLMAAMPGLRTRSLGFTRSREPAGQISRARALAAREQVDCLVAVGSGAVIRAAAEVAGHTALPLVALPTSYAGAEFGSPPDVVAGHRRKPRPAGPIPPPGPRIVIYDPALTVGLPDRVTGSSAMRALAHGVDVLCTPDASPVAAMMAEAGIRQIADGAPDAILHPHGLVGRSRTQYGAYLTAASLAVTAPGPHRILGEAVEHACGLRQTDVGAVLLPYLLAVTGERRPLDLARIAAAMGCNDAVQGALDLARDLGAPQSLKELGVAPASLASAVAAVRDDAAVVRDTRLNPDALAALVENAYRGHSPGDLAPPQRLRQEAAPPPTPRTVH